MPILERDLEILACPSCKTNPLDSSKAVFDRGALSSGILLCPDCGRETTIIGGVPFFAPWADDLSRAEKVEAWRQWARAHANYRRWHETVWTEASARRSRPIFEAFWKFAKVEGIGVDIGGGRSVNREWNPGATIWSVDPEASWALDPVPKFMASMYRCWNEPFPFAQGVGEMVPLKTASLHFAIIQGVLDHVADPSAVIAEARRVLRPGGTLWMMITTTDLEPHVPLHKAIRRRLGRARRYPLELIEQGPVRFFSSVEQGIAEGHVAESLLTRESLADWLRPFDDVAYEDIDVAGVRQVFVRASRPATKAARRST